MSFVIQGRVFADSPSEAAVKIRDKYNGCQGKLAVLGAEEKLGWYEYMLCLTED